MRDIALWEDVEIRLRDDLIEKMYEEEVGLRISHRKNAYRRRKFRI